MEQSSVECHGPGAASLGAEAASCTATVEHMSAVECHWSCAASLGAEAASNTTTVECMRQISEDQQKAFEDSLALGAASVNPKAGI